MVAEDGGAFTENTRRVAFVIRFLKGADVRDPVHVHYRLHPVRDTGIGRRRLQFGHPVRKPDHQGEVPAGRAADHADMVPIELESVRVAQVFGLWWMNGWPIVPTVIMLLLLIPIMAFNVRRFRSSRVV